MKTPSPFLVVPWQNNFLQALLDYALDDTGGDISKAVFIFPHARPERYLTRLLRLDTRVQRPLIMPDMHTVNGLFSTFRSHILARPAWEAGLLDRVGLLLECVREESAVPEGDIGAFARLSDARVFFPWGIRLSSLFEECFSQHRKPTDFFHTEGGQVAPFAEALLGKLQQIFTRYSAGLEKHGWTTPGFDAACTVDHLQQTGYLPDQSLAGNSLYIAGFHTLTGTENALFRHLWEQKGAHILLHADPAVIKVQGPNNNAAHWSCQAFIDWSVAWGAGLTFAEHYGSDDVSAQTSPRIRFVQGFDLHSQLAVLKRELETDPPPPVPPHHCMNGREEDRNKEPEDSQDTAIVLSDSGLLMPVLHHLPPRDSNISMGYPLSHSPLFRLVDSITRLQQNRKGASYYWRDLMNLIRHPYIKMLQTLPENDPEQNEQTKTLQQNEDTHEQHDLRRELHRLEQSLRAERCPPYRVPAELLESHYQFLDPAEMPSANVLTLLENVFRVCLAGFENPHTPRDIARALEGLCSLLLAHGAHLWERFPIDAECLFRLMQSLIPELARSQLSSEPLPPDTLFAVLRRLLEEERVPFEALPLVGTQIMGMQETRLLSFRRVIIGDAVEDRLPGSPAGDPLLPEELRLKLGLPSLHSRERVAAYHFFRLIAGAQEVLLLWQEGAESAGGQGLGEKQKKSRFVEELLWEEEKKQGRILSGKKETPFGNEPSNAERDSTTDGPLRVLAASVTPLSLCPQPLPLTPQLRALVQDTLGRPISASLLDTYLRCPLLFLYERPLRLASVEEINERDDPLAVGELFHQVLQECYAPRLGTSLPGGKELLDCMGNALTNAFFSSPGFAERSRLLPADSLAMLKAAGKKRLNDYLENQPPTKIMGLETTFTIPFTGRDASFTLTGTVDRIDCRSIRIDEKESTERSVILDYKTGYLPRVNESLWTNDKLWRDMERWRPEQETELREASASPLNALASHMESVQLPLYLLLFSRSKQLDLLPEMRAASANPAVLDARWIELAYKGEEHSLFSAKFPLHQRRKIVENRLPILIDFLLRHMRDSFYYLPRTGQHCRWCPVAKCCRVALFC